jgi:hypothetical protein
MGCSMWKYHATFLLNDLCSDTKVRVLLRFPQMVAYTLLAVQEAEQPTNRLWRRMETTELGAYGLEMRWSEAKFRNRVPLWEPEVWTWFRDVRPSRGSDTKSTARQIWHTTLETCYKLAIRRSCRQVTTSHCAGLYTRYELYKPK